MLSNFEQKSLIVKDLMLFVQLLPAEGLECFFEGGLTLRRGWLRMRV